MALSISLTPQLEQMVRDKVESGMYNSASEVVREALRLLDEQEELRQIRLKRLRAEIQKGIDSGPPIPFDEVMQNLRDHFGIQE